MQHFLLWDQHASIKTGGQSKIGGIQQPIGQPSKTQILHGELKKCICAIFVSISSKTIADGSLAQDTSIRKAGNQKLHLEHIRDRYGSNTRKSGCKNDDDITGKNFKTFMA